MPPALEVFVRFARLGLTAFGGPVAHLGYFRREFVERAGWLDDAAFAEIVALCSVLPGPTSSQVGMLLGMRRAGLLGAVLAWFAFTLPAALIMAACGFAFRARPDAFGDAHLPATLGGARNGAVTGLGCVAAAVVALAVVQLARGIVVTRFAAIVAPLAALAALALYETAPAYVWLVLLAGGALGALFANAPAPSRERIAHLPRAAGIAALVALATLLVVPGTLARGHPYAATLATFARAGGSVFGGGHVVLTYLAALAGDGHVPRGTFVAGYGLAQALPGPLFTFSAFLGAADRTLPDPLVGATVALLALFAPSPLLLCAALALWNDAARWSRFGATLAGLSAAVVGMLGAAFVDPVLRSLPPSPASYALACGCYGLLAVARWPAWCVVLAGAVAGAAGGALIAPR